MAFTINNLHPLLKVDCNGITKRAMHALNIEVMIDSQAIKILNSKSESRLQRKTLVSL